MNNRAFSCISFGTKCFREFIFADWRFFVFCGNWFLLLAQICYFAGNLFLRFSESTPYPALTIFSFLLSTCNRNAYFQTILGQYCGVRQYFVVYRFVSERKRQVVIEQTRFLSTVFLCSKFKSENIYSGVNFCGKMFCGYFYLRELIFVDRWKKRKNRKKLEPAKFRAPRYLLCNWMIVTTASFARQLHCFVNNI